jgi:hypothetical protein
MKGKAGAGGGTGGAGIPELAGRLTVKVLRAEEGGIKAERACVVCGLKREERVVGAGAGLDGADVWDQFGEWWIDHWGHRECKDWWEGSERELRKQR